MQEYDYEIADREGQIVTGQMQAESKKDVVRQLTQTGQTVIQVNLHQANTRSVLRRKLKTQEVVIALHELATLLESGVSLAAAIDAQARGSYHPVLMQAFDTMSRNLMRGETLLFALRESGLPLPEYLFNLVEAGELSGQLANSLREAVAQMEYDQRVAGEFKNALTYPAILVLTGISAVLMIFIFVVPKFSNLLNGRNDLPWLAEFVLSAGVWFNNNTWLLLGGLLVTGAVLAQLFKQAEFRQKLLDGLARLPVIGEWLSEADTAKWASVMAAMLSSRVELMDSMTLAGKGIRIRRRRLRMEASANDVRAGSSLAEALEKQNALSATGYNLIRVGEQSGQLAAMLRSLARLYDENSTRRMKQALTILEPLAVLLIGAVLGVIMIGIILAITSVNDVGL